jgi:hypothetical protein
MLGTRLPTLNWSYFDTIFESRESSATQPRIEAGPPVAVRKRGIWSQLSSVRNHPKPTRRIG